MRVKALVAAVGLAVSMAASLPAPSQAQDAAELALRIDWLEARLRTLTGLIEELVFQVQDLEQLVAVLRADNEALYRLLGEADIGPNRALVAAAPVAEMPAVGAPLRIGNAPAILGEVPADPAQQIAGGPLDLMQAIRPDGGFNIDDGVNVVGGGVPAAGLLVEPEEPAAPQVAALTGVAAADYDIGYRYVLNGDYALAEDVFRNFLVAYPGNPLSVDARFWLAESMFSRGMYREAASEFYDAFIANPQHEKAPDMLLKLGISLAQLGQAEAACGTFEQVLQRYPDVSNALRLRLATEQVNAGC